MLIGCVTKFLLLLALLLDYLFQLQLAVSKINIYLQKQFQKAHLNTCYTLVKILALIEV